MEYLKRLLAAPTIGCIGLVLFSCGKLSREPVAPPSGLSGFRAPVHVAEILNNDPFAKRRWIGRVAELLRNGEGLTSTDHLNELSKLPPEQIVDAFMKDSRFLGTVADFEMKYLGLTYPGNSRKVLSYPNSILSQTPQILSSLRELAEEGDFLQFLAYEQPLFVFPVNIFGLPPGADLDKLIQERHEDFLKTWDQLTDLANQGLSQNHLAFCNLFLNDNKSIFNKLFDSGIPFQLMAKIEFSFDWLADLVAYCSLPKYPGERIPAELPQIRARFVDLLAAIRGLTPSHYPSPQTFKDVRTLDPASIHLKPEDSTAFTTELYVQIKNASTNYNRKRASYVLKRYFCDDLTPIGGVAPGTGHGGNRHASDPACQACHYKLDPMAGFFRDLGVVGMSFAQSPVILFDDLVAKPRDEYQEAWKAPKDSGRVWDVGYVRSVEDPKYNQYGETFQDLFRIIRTAPEAKRCLMRRVYEYAVGDNQSIDAQYLDYLADAFTEEAKLNSSQAFKAALKRVVLSNAFAEEDRATDECYDYAPGMDPKGRPPCQVAYLFQKNCAQCHSSSSARAGLDLVSWIPLENGQMGFPHKKAGQQLARKETFTRILERLTSADPDRRMPLGQFMPPEDREKMVLWVDGLLKSDSRGGQ